MANPRIAHMQPDDVDRVRAARLRALADAPDAFGTTLAEDQARPLPEWRARLESSGAATYLATRDGHDIGMATGVGVDDTTAALCGMWVAGESRGSGAADALVHAVIAWARARGCRRVILEVADENARAVQFYARMGFEPTGGTGSLPPPREHILEHERELTL